MTDRDKWDEQRCALLGHMVGSGHKVEAIAEELGTTSGNVYRQTSRFGLSFRTAPVTSMSPRTYGIIRAAAVRRGTDPVELINLILRTLAADVTLLENVLDDQHSHAYFAGMP